MRISATIIDEDPTDLLDLFSRNFDVLNDTHMPAPIQFTTKTQMKHHFLKMHEEVTQKFQNLHLSEESSAFMGAAIDDTASNTMENIAVSSKDVEAAPAWLQQYLLQMKHEIKKEVLEELLQTGSSEEAHCSKLASAVKLHDIQDEIVHNGIYCDNCDQIIQGIRYKCVNCSDFDLCQECESLPYIHNAYHIFLKVRHPLPLRLKQVEEPACNRVVSKSKKLQTKKLYEARFIKDDTVPDSTVLTPSTQFVKSWRIMNSGTRVWNHSTKLQLIQGSAELTPTSEQVDVPHLRPGEVGVVSVIFTTPPLPGLYRSHWNFCHKSRPFGDIVWCHIIVHTDGAKAGTVLAEKPTAALKVIVPKKAIESKQNEASCIEQVLTAVKKEHERGNMVPRKVVATSHTATPNNTPFDLSPPKSPDHHETTVKELHNLTPGSIYPAKVSDNEEDKCSVVSLGSSESDAEFVVIPMPKCFNMTESFLAQDIPQWVRGWSPDTVPMPKTPQSDNSEEPIPDASKSTSKRPSLTSETVSQETGVPELSGEQTVLKIVEQQKDGGKVNCISVLTDGSSSEISIIESEENSPVTEQAPALETVNISVSSFPRDGNTIEVRLDNTMNERAVEEEIIEYQEAANIPNSATFPKFPVEGITASFDPAPASNEERTIQVLPEGLVTGALSAAASVYNTARAAINAMQQTRVEQGVVLSPTDENNSLANLILNPMEQLAEMGFCNRPQNEELLKKHKGDVAQVVAELVSQNDNDWYASRHIPCTPPAFD